MYDTLKKQRSTDYWFKLQRNCDNMGSRLAALTQSEFSSLINMRSCVVVSTDKVSVAIKLLVKVEIREKFDIMLVRTPNQRHVVAYGYGFVCWHISQMLWCFETLNKGE